jgi:hypothetical protein
MHQRAFVFITFLFLSFYAVAQKGKLSGTVYEAGTKTPLAFVSVVIKETKTGVITDIYGRFYFLQAPEKTTLIISYIGYKTKELTVPPDGQPVNIEIEHSGKQLETVVINSGENPAHRIIRLLLENKKKNDPDFKPSFKYNAYTVAALGAGNLLFSRGKNDTAAKQKKATPPKENIKDKKKTVLLLLYLKALKKIT